MLAEDCTDLVAFLRNVHAPLRDHGIDIGIDVAPHLSHISPIEKSALDAFFSAENTQKNMLAPFQRALRGVTSVKISGVEPNLARAVQASIEQDEWTDPLTALYDIRAAEKLGHDLHAANKLCEASQIWRKVAGDIQRMQWSSSWKPLCARDDSFIERVNAIYLSLCLRLSHIQLSGIDNPIPGYPARHRPTDYLEEAKEEIEMARVALSRFPEHFTNLQMAELAFGEAMVRRSEARLSRLVYAMKQALRLVKQARDLAPEVERFAAEEAQMQGEHEKMVERLDENWTIQRHATGEWPEDSDNESEPDLFDDGAWGLGD